MTNPLNENNFNRRNNFLDKRPQINKNDKNANQSSKGNPNNIRNKSTPELVGAPIRREDSRKNLNRQNFHNKQNFSKQTPSNRSDSPNIQGIQNRQTSQQRSNGVNNQSSPNKPRIPNRPNEKFRQSGSFKQGNINKNNPKFNHQKPSAVRKPVSRNDLMQLQKTNASDKEKLKKTNLEKQNIEVSKQRAKSPNNSPNNAPS